MSLLSGVYAKTPLNTTEISQSVLNIETKLRANPLPWNGQFSPQLVEALLHRYATPAARVLDPFLGSGTVLFESGRLGLEVVGTEINPAALILASTYSFINTPRKVRESCIGNVTKLLLENLPDASRLFEGQSPSLTPEEIESALLRINAILDERPDQALVKSLIILLDVYNRNISSQKVILIWNRLKKLVMDLPFAMKTVRVIQADARAIPVPDGHVDLVVTSPPYINVFNYHQRYRASAELLGWDLLKVAQSEIGSNRKNRGNRFVTVVQFCLEMAQALKELRRVCKPGSRAIFIVGRESMVRGTPLYNGEIVAEVAHRSLGFDLLLRQERVFLNRFGQKIYEDILHFGIPPGSPSVDFMNSARAIAGQVLASASHTAPSASIDDIQSALKTVHMVSPSPIFSITKANIKGAHNG